MTSQFAVTAIGVIKWPNFGDLHVLSW